jgi:hypothetical protein
MRQRAGLFCMTLHDAKHPENLLFLSFLGVLERHEKRASFCVFSL